LPASAELLRQSGQLVRLERVPVGPSGECRRRRRYAIRLSRAGGALTDCR